MRPAVYPPNVNAPRNTAAATSPAMSPTCCQSLRDRESRANPISCRTAAVIPTHAPITPYATKTPATTLRHDTPPQPASRASSSRSRFPSTHVCRSLVSTVRPRVLMVPSPPPPSDLWARVPSGRAWKPRSGRGRSRSCLDVHRDAVQHRVARQRIEEIAVGEEVAVDAGASGGNREVGPADAVTPAVGDADDARHDGVGHLDRDCDLPRAGPHAGGGAADDAQAGGVVGMDVQGAALLPLHEDV